jgi:hypothetical protein
MNVRALRAGLRVAEVPSREARRIHGTSNLRTFPDGMRVLRTIVREWGRPSAPGAIAVRATSVRIGRRVGSRRGVRSGLHDPR